MPGIWTIISCMLIECLRTKTDGATFFDTSREIKVNRVCSGFVDDITHLVNSFSKSLFGEESIEELKEKTRVTAQWWEELLHATGGKLELQKCFFYLMAWMFDGEGTAKLVSSTESTDQQVSITNSKTGEEVTIERKECSESHKTLGAIENPTGDFHEEVKRLLEKSRKMAQCISSATVRRSEAITIFRSMYM